MDGAATQLDRNNPWPGLESFEESSRDYFHGREAEAEDLLRRVVDAPLTVLFGKSGLGKTSLLKAGLFPRLREKSFLPVLVRLDIRPDAPELGDQLRENLLAAFARERIDAPPFNDGESLWEYLHRADLELWSEQNYPLTPVLVIDQFEEVFTLGERLPESVEGCRIDLGDLAENRIPAALAGRMAIDPTAAQGLDLRRMAYKLVVTLREDFLPHLEGWRGAVPSLGRVRVRLLPMRPEQALSAVYDTAPHLMDEPLARRIVEFVAAAAQGEGTAPESVAGGEIEPALLSLFCRGLNERRKQQGADRFDEQLLVGAQQGIIADYYRSCVEGLPDSVSRFIEADLITEKGFRNSYAKDDAVPAILTEEQLGRLINRRLLRVEERYGTARIELTHDLLTRAVMADRDRRRVEEEKVALAAQTRTQRRRLRAMAFVALVCLAFAGIAAWQWWAAVHARKASERAKIAAETAQRDAVRLKGVAEQASAFAERKALSARIAESEARKAESEAQTQTQLARESAEKELVARGSSEARRMETEARLVFDESKDEADALVKATLLSVASLRRTRTIDGQVSLTRFLGLLPKAAPLWRRSGADDTTDYGEIELAVSPDGERIALVDVNGSVQLLDARTGRPLRSFAIPPDKSYPSLVFSPDGALLVASCESEACVLDTASGQLLVRLPSAGAEHPVKPLSFSPDGQQLAMSSHGTGEVLVYDVATWKATATIRAGDETVHSVAFSPEGQWLATGDRYGVKLWRAGHYEAPVAQASAPGLVFSLAFQPDDGGLVAGSSNVHAWRIEGDESTTRLEPEATFPVQAHDVSQLWWHYRSCFAAAGTYALHLLCGESLDEVLRIPVRSAAAGVSPDGRTLFSQQEDGVLAAWSLDVGPDIMRVPLGERIEAMASSEQGGWLAAGIDSGEVAIFGHDSLKERKRLRPGLDTVHEVAASSDGRWLAVAQGGSLHVFDTRNWREVASGTYQRDIAGMAFDTGNRWLVVETGTLVVVWQPGVWRERWRMDSGGKIDAVKVSANGRQLAATNDWPGQGTYMHALQILDLTSGKETEWEYSSAQDNSAPKFIRGPAEGELASAVREVSSWPALELREPMERVSADGVWQVRVKEQVATLRDVASNRVIAAFDHGHDIVATRFVPAHAPRWLVSVGKDGMLAAWPLRADDLAREACARLRTVFGAQALDKLIAGAHAEGSCESALR